MVVTCTHERVTITPLNCVRGEIRVAMATTPVVAAKAGETRDHYGQIKVRCLVYTARTTLLDFHCVTLRFIFVHHGSVIFY